MKEHILVVDDEEFVLTGLAASIEAEGYRVSTAPSAREALEVLALTPVDLVLTDLVMEEMDGLALLRRVAERLPDVPVVVITGHGTAKSALEAMRQGAADYIQKPVRPAEIIHRIQTVLAAHQLRRRMERERETDRAQRDVKDQRMARQDRMESLRLMAEGLAEEMEQIVDTLASDRAGLEAALPPDHPARAIAGRHAEGVKRLRHLHDDLQFFQSARRDDTEQCDLNETVQAYLASPAFVALHDTAPAVHVETRLKEGIPSARVAASALRTMVHMLAGHAIESVRGPGRLLLITGREQLAQAEGHYREVAAGPFVYVRLVHSAQIKWEDLDRLFEPFYALRRMGRHSAGGLGLTRIYSAVRNTGGFTHMRADPHLGTEITLYFPLASADAQPNEALLGSGRILVVDDSEAHRREAAGLLAEMGYDVAEVVSGAAAVDLIRRRHENQEPGFDLVLLDVVLGEEADGVEILRRIREIEPDQKVILAGGFADTERIAEAHRIGISAYVRKPFEREVLGGEVREAMERG